MNIPHHDSLTTLCVCQKMRLTQSKGNFFIRETCETSFSGSWPQGNEPALRTRWQLKLTTSGDRSCCPIFHPDLQSAPNPVLAHPQVTSSSRRGQVDRCSSRSPGTNQMEHKFHLQGRRHHHHYPLIKVKLQKSRPLASRTRARSVRD